jgi:DNA-binding HxlR family transcriptional regulator
MAIHGEPQQCDASRARIVLDLVGDKWSLLVVRSLRHGPRRFTEIKRDIDGISQRMLTVTLRGLDATGS